MKDKNDKKKRIDNSDLKGGIFTNVGFLTLLILLFLLIGTLGYYTLDEPNWIEAIYTSGSIMSGVGATDAPKTDAGKLFSLVFGLATNLLFLFIVGYVVQFYLRKSESEKKE